MHLMLLRVSLACLVAFGATSSASAEEPLHALEVTMTAYSSTEDQTSGDPYLTATGEKVRLGIVAVSRDLLETQLPYGTKVQVLEIREDPEACGGYLPDMVLEVQDTMAAHLTNKVDIWLPTRSEAEAWGTCIAVLEVVAYE